MNQNTIRIDKWLWYARFFKSRTLASKLCASGKLRLNCELICKGHATLKEGDVLTFPKEDDVRVIKIISIASRRGPASEAETLYDDLEPPQSAKVKKIKRASAVAIREAGAGRPTKAERRAIDKLRDYD
jgi:ribosome-associated heat shock protein Hsp15